MALIGEDDSPPAPSPVPLPELEAVDTGTTANDGTGDPLRTSFDKINANLALLLGQLQRYSPQAWEVTTIQTADYAASVGSYCIRMDTTAGNLNVTLPVAADVEGQIYRIVKWDSSANDVVVVKDSGDSWFGFGGSLTSQYEVVTLMAMPDGWLKI